MPWSTLEIWLHSLNAEAWCDAASSKSGTVMLGSAAIMEPCYARHPLEIRKSNWMHQNILMEVHFRCLLGHLDFSCAILSSFPASRFILPMVFVHFTQQDSSPSGAPRMCRTDGVARRNCCRDLGCLVIQLLWIFHGLCSRKARAFLEHFWRILSW